MCAAEVGQKVGERRRERKTEIINRAPWLGLSTHTLNSWDGCYGLLKTRHDVSLLAAFAWGCRSVDVCDTQNLFHVGKQ